MGEHPEDGNVMETERLKQQIRPTERRGRAEEEGDQRGAKAPGQLRRLRSGQEPRAPGTTAKLSRAKWSPQRSFFPPPPISGGKLSRGRKVFRVDESLR